MWFKTGFTLIILLLCTGVTAQDTHMFSHKQNALILYNRFRAGYEDMIIIDKTNQKLYLIKNGTYINTFEIGLSINKRKQTIYHNWSTPEGDFFVCKKAKTKRYYKFLAISYPNYHAAEYGLRKKIINNNQYAHIIDNLNNKKCPPWNTKLGGSIGIHGEKKISVSLLTFSIGKKFNWTRGCISLNNDDMDELYELVKTGTRVIIYNGLNDNKKENKALRYFIETFLY